MSETKSQKRDRFDSDYLNSYSCTGGFCFAITIFFKISLIYDICTKKNWQFELFKRAGYICVDCMERVDYYCKVILKNHVQLYQSTACHVYCIQTIGGMLGIWVSKLWFFYVKLPPPPPPPPHWLFHYHGQIILLYVNEVSKAWQCES